MTLTKFSSLELPLITFKQLTRKNSVNKWLNVLFYWSDSVWLVISHAAGKKQSDRVWPGSTKQKKLSQWTQTTVHNK